MKKIYTVCFAFFYFPAVLLLNGHSSQSVSPLFFPDLRQHPLYISQTKHCTKPFKNIFFYHPVQIIFTND